MAPVKAALFRCWLRGSPPGVICFLPAELHALLTGLAISSKAGAPEDVDHWMQDFDEDNDGKITQLEFVNGLPPLLP